MQQLKSASEQKRVHSQSGWTQRGHHIHETHIHTHTHTHTHTHARRRQVQRLEERIRALEAEKDEFAASAGDATKPLLKQIESMASAAAAAAQVMVVRRIVYRM